MPRKKSYSLIALYTKKLAKNNLKNTYGLPLDVLEKVLDYYKKRGIHSSTKILSQIDQDNIPGIRQKHKDLIKGLIPQRRLRVGKNPLTPLDLKKVKWMIENYHGAKREVNELIVLLNKKVSKRIKQKKVGRRAILAV